MPRRPSKKPGGKKPRAVDKKDARVKRWDTRADIPMDEEDQFEAARDRILLEGEEGGASDDGDEEEVFALGLGDSDEDDGEEEEDEDADEDDVPAPPPKTSKKQKKGKPAPPASDEDVNTDEDEEEEGWGRKKGAYYASNADAIASDDDEANELEEQEARRLQLRARAALRDDDFGLDELVAQREVVLEVDLGVDEPAPQSLPQPKDKAAALRHLEKTSPETLALARDWEDVAWAITTAQAKLDRISANPDADTLSQGMIHLHHQTLLAYASTLAFYLSLRASPRYAARPELLREHAVLGRLLALKRALATLDDLDFGQSDDEDDEDDEESIELTAEQLTALAKEQGLDVGELAELLQDAGLNAAEDEAPRRRTTRGAPAVGLDTFDLTTDANKKKKARAVALDDLDGMDDIELSGPEATRTKKKKGKAAAPDDLDDIELPKTKKKKAKAAVSGLADINIGFSLDDTELAPSKPAKKKKTKALQPIFDLVEPDVAPTDARSARAAAPAAPADAFGELAALPAVDAQDKRARKKTLQFYTARVERAGARREGARQLAGGGDDDLPYRTREKRPPPASRGQGGDDLDDAEPAPRGTKRTREEDAEEEGPDGGDGYYALVKKQARARKEAKKTAHDSERAAARVGAETGGADGPRAVTRAILANKGLTPHRAKSVRNPRVKKRIRFAQAQKKVASQRATFKSGTDAGRYAGERSGISKVVKSTRL